MLTPWGARRRVKGGTVPHGVWAKVLGIHRVTFSNLLAGKQCLQTGPAMKRLIELLDGLDNGSWRFEVVGPRDACASYRWVLPEPVGRKATMARVVDGRLVLG